MSASNYPPGMTRRDYDHVEGVVRCEECGCDITREIEDLDLDPEAPLVCPGGCAEDPREDYDYMRDREMEDAANGYDRYAY